MRYIILLCILCCGIIVNAQQPSLLINVRDAEDSSLLEATIRIRAGNTTQLSGSNAGATVIFSSPGTYKLLVRAVGYAELAQNYIYIGASDTLNIYLEREEEELEEIIIQSTRISRSIANEPARVETIEGEEIDEKNNMRPGNVVMLLHESTGIQVQQTSATSASAAIRIQGLDGRYTQLLKDGFPNFGNFSGGLSVLEIPPLDLQQVEIIKGPASTLYGAGAIAGVVNFISKTPGDEPAYNFILNQSNVGQSNVGGFMSARSKKIGVTMLATYNRQKAYDVDDDDFTELPKTSDYTLHPRLFIYPSANTTISIGNSFTSATRSGGDVFVIKAQPDAGHQYIEKNKTVRNITTLELQRKLRENDRLLFRQSVSQFRRTIELPGYVFQGKDLTAYTDASYVTNRTGYSLVLGMNVNLNRFRDRVLPARDEENLALGVYGQHTFRATDKIEIESGLRIDHLSYSNPNYKDDRVFVLPRVSALFTLSESFTSRVGAGFGYKSPSLFTEATETFQYRGLQPLSNVRPEKSYGGTADATYRTRLGMDLQLTVNHMFFVTAIRNPLLLDGAPGFYFLVNGDRPLLSAGFETNARFIYRKNFKVFLGYTYTDVRAHSYPGKPFLPLVPKHKLNTAIIYEKEDVIKLGLEGYFTGRQHLSNGSMTPAFEELGFMAEKIFGWFSVYINFENFTDTRQSRYKPVVSGSHLDPVFDEIWTHTEGRTINGGVKIRL